MEDSDIRRIVREEIQRALTPIMMGFVVSNDSVQRATINRMSLEGPIPNTRSIQPYGFASRAPAGTEGIMIPVNGDPTNINMVGHFDKTRPEVQDGESTQYDSFGHEVYLSASGLQFGSQSSANPMMLGDIVQTLFSNLIQLIADHTHYGNLGYPTSAPVQAPDFLNLKASPVDDGAIISDKAFTEK
jgi:hypothetical protein